MKTMPNLITKDLEQIKTTAAELLQKSEDAESVDAKKDLEADLDEVLGYYAATAKNACFEACFAAEDPMKHACVEYFYQIIRVKETKDKATGSVTRTIDNAYRQIDLRELHSKKAIGHDPNWIHDAEKLNFYLSIRGAERVGAKINSDSFRMSEVAKQRSLGKNPCSNTNLLRTLQQIITEMIGDEYKPTSHDVNYLVDVYANDSKRSKTAITLANHKTLAGYLKKVCRHIITGEPYEVVQPEIKENK